jgi:hypothetical protein
MRQVHFLLIVVLFALTSFTIKAFADFDRVLTLQVGSRLFTVAREVLLRKDSMLCRMFSDLEFENTENGRLATGAYFIDADEEAFSHVIEFLRQDTITIKEGRTLPQLKRLYALADRLSFWELKAYVAQEIWNETPDEKLNSISYDVWKNIPEVPLHIVERLGRSKKFSYFMMNQNGLILGSDRVGHGSKPVLSNRISNRKGNLVIASGPKGKMPYNALNGIAIGDPGPTRLGTKFHALPLLTTVTGFYMCSVAGSASKFAIFHILTGKRPFPETYSSLADCAKDLCSVYGWCEDSERS